MPLANNFCLPSIFSCSLQKTDHALAKVNSCLLLINLFCSFCFQYGRFNQGLNQIEKCKPHQFQSCGIFYLYFILFFFYEFQAGEAKDVFLLFKCQFSNTLNSPFLFSDFSFDSSICKFLKINNLVSKISVNFSYLSYVRDSFH